MKKAIQEAVRRAAQKGTGKLFFGFLDLQTGEEIYHNGDKPFPLASVYKIFTLCELFRQQRDGEVSLSEKHVLQESDKRPGSGILESVQAGAVLTLHDYMMLMMIISDNTSSGILARRVGRENIRSKILAPLELHETLYNLDRDMLPVFYGMEDEEYRRACAAGHRFYARNGSYFACTEPKNVQSSPRDMLTIIRRLYEGKMIDPASDAEILDVMSQCQTNTRIPKLLPQGVRVAHKTGTIDHLANDVGIVYTARGNYALAMSYNGNLCSEEEYMSTRGPAVGDSFLAQLSREIYDAFTAD